MLSVPKKSANKTGINRYQQPKHNPYAADENTTKYEWLPNGIDKTARPAPKMLRTNGKPNMRKKTQFAIELPLFDIPYDKCLFPIENLQITQIPETKTSN